MADESYHRLRAFLDQFPLGYPKTASGVEMRILKRLFTEEEAETVTCLGPIAEEASRIASRLNTDEKALTKKLEVLADKGLIFRIRRGETTLFNAVPFMIGLYEYSVQDMDEGLAALYKEYYEEAYQAEMAVSNVPGFKVIPIGHTVDEEMALIPSCMLEEQVRKARVISVAPCICRREARLAGKGCGRPEETCLHFGAAAEFYIENGIGRQVDAEEALAIIQRSDRAGLVHAGVNTQHLSNICNCCPCCCASMKGITLKGMDRHGFLNALFLAVVDEGSCTGCGACVERCPVQAVSVDDRATADPLKCLGCGLCSTACPAEAITMHLRKDREEPFATVIDMGFAILEGKEQARKA
ncbi:MAG TPA: 4Fe-4S binding protein [Deltaproteobacteria bacterium]|nr:4Fe-4S binding protein [Deltaproteobacteria bacterium]